MPGTKLIKSVARRVLRKELARQQRALADAQAELASARVIGHDKAAATVAWTAARIGLSMVIPLTARGQCVFTHTENTLRRGFSPSDR